MYISSRLRLRLVGILILTLLALFVQMGGPLPHALALCGPSAYCVAEYPIPTISSNAEGITAGPDGNVWFTEKDSNKLGRFANGVITEFLLAPGSSKGPMRITRGPDGNLWFTENAANAIGRFTTTGVLTEYPLPHANSGPVGIASDGVSLWFTEASGNRIGRITTAGVITESAIPTPGSFPWGIAVGPSGTVWFTEGYGNQIGQLASVQECLPFGKIQKCTNHLEIFEYPIPTAAAFPPSGGQPTNFPMGIAAGPDGNMWFAENYAGRVGRITPGGTITEFMLPTLTTNSGATSVLSPTDITPDSQGDMCFTEDRSIGCLVLSGIYAGTYFEIAVTQTLDTFGLPHTDTFAITLDNRGALVFTDLYPDFAGSSGGEAIGVALPEIG